MVEEIEYLRPKLEIELLCKLCVFGDREIRVHEVWPRDGVATKVTGVTNSSDTRRGEQSRVAKPLRWIACGLNRPGNVRPDNQGDAWPGADGQCGVDRASRLRLLSEPELPAGNGAVRLEGQFVEAAKNETMADVKLRWAIISSRIVGILQQDALARGQGVVVQGLGEGVGSLELQAVGKVLVNRSPQRVVVGITSAVDLAVATEVAKSAARYRCALRGEHGTV